MEADKRKKVSDFMWWLIFVAIIAWAISTRPLFIFGLSIIGAIAFYCYHSPPKSADTDGKEAAAKEHKEYLAEVEETKAYFATTTEKMREIRSNTDSFYSGVSGKSSIDEGGTKSDA